MISIDLQKNLNEFIDTVQNIDYKENAMFNSEIYPIYCLYKQLNIDAIIESGIDNGGSTEKLLHLTDCKYTGIDQNCNCNFISTDEYKNYKNFEFECGWAEQILSNIIQNNKNKKLCVILDGPKNIQAIFLKNKILNYDCVKIVAVHDTYDGLENETDFRIFETKNFPEYNEKYFNVLNKLGNINIFNKKNLTRDPEKTYSEVYPTGPGISIYSKIQLNFSM